MPVLLWLHRCLWPWVFLRQWSSTHFTTTAQSPAQPLEQVCRSLWAWLPPSSVALLQSGAVRIHANSFISEFCASALLRFPGSGEWRWGTSVLCIPLKKKDLWMNALQTSPGYWKPVATQVCCGSSSERKSLHPPWAICFPLVSRMLDFIGSAINSSSACLLWLGSNWSWCSVKELWRDQGKGKTTRNHWWWLCGFNLFKHL